MAPLLDPFQLHYSKNIKIIILVILVTLIHLHYFFFFRIYIYFFLLQPLLPSAIFIRTYKSTLCRGEMCRYVVECLFYHLVDVTWSYTYSVATCQLLRSWPPLTWKVNIFWKIKSAVVNVGVLFFQLLKR